jgi:hypothetical protein
MDALGARLYGLHFGVVRPAPRETVRELIAQASAEVPGHRFSPGFLLAEWEQVVDAWQIESWEAYRDVARLGRKTRLPEAQRALLWSIFERVRAGLAEQGLVTTAQMFTRLAARIPELPRPPFDFAVIDEAQDVSVGQLRCLAALGGARPNGLFFAGDLGQRIFQQPFSWKALGVDIRGRSRTLRINYRTSHQIRMHADRLLDPELADVDGIAEERRGTVSVFNGAQPLIARFETPGAEITAVSQWLRARAAEGIAPHEIGVFVRSEAQFPRAQAAVESAGLTFRLLNERVETATAMSRSAPCTWRKGWSSARSRSWPATTRSSRSWSGSRASRMKLTWRMPTTQSGSSSTWRAHAHATTSS